MTITDIADEIFRELGEPSDVTIPTITFWLSSNIGKLNNLIDTAFSVTNGTTIEPDMGEIEKTIFKTLYFIYYFKRKVNQNLGAAAYMTISEVKEGNRTVRRTNKTEVAKNFQRLVDDYNSELSDAILAYRMNAADPLDVITHNPLSFCYDCGLLNCDCHCHSRC